jgi:hypothetical protein
VNLYAACPAHAPEVETTLFLAKDDADAFRQAKILLRQDQRFGYDSPNCLIWEIQADVRDVGAVVLTDADRRPPQLGDVLGGAR